MPYKKQGANGGYVSKRTSKAAQTRKTNVAVSKGIASPYTPGQKGPTASAITTKKQAKNNMAIQANLVKANEIGKKIKARAAYKEKRKQATPKQP